MIRGALVALTICCVPTQAGAHEHSDVRRFVIESQLAQAGNNTVVLLGDSITESAMLPSTICGRQLINAGVGGTTASSYLNSILSGIPAFKADAIVVALGTNDAIRETKNFRADYERLVYVLKDYSISITLAGIPSVGQALDKDIKSIADQNSMKFVPLTQDIEGYTVDDIHLSPMGYQHWRDVILGAIRTNLRC